MNWNRYHGLALPTAPEMLPRVTERISDVKDLGMNETCSAFIWLFRTVPMPESK